jgi:hypothetical protein
MIIVTDINNKRDGLTKQDIISTIRAVSKWKNIAEVYGTKENMDKAENMLAELHRLLESVGVKVPKTKTKVKKRMSQFSLYHFGCT